MKAQDKFIQDFLNDVAEAVVDKDFRYFYYADYGFGHDGVEKEQAIVMRNELLKKYPDFPKGLLETSDTTSVSWVGYVVKNGRPVSEQEYDNKYRHMFGIVRHRMPYNTSKKVLDSLNGLKHDEVYAAVNEKWSDEKIEQAMQQAMNEKREELDCFRFCTPIFSGDKKYAVIEVDTGGTGQCYIFKYKNGKWIKLEEFGRWIS
ncbi:hypothetical protein ACX0HA_11555 [Flavobacterium hauense]